MADTSPAKAKKGGARFGGMGKALGAVSKLGKGTSKLARRGLSAAKASVTLHGKGHHGGDSSDDDEGDDTELRDVRVMELFRSLSLQGGRPNHPQSQLVREGSLCLFAVPRRRPVLLIICARVSFMHRMAPGPSPSVSLTHLQ